MILFFYDGFTSNSFFKRRHEARREGVDEAGIRYAVWYQRPRWVFHVSTCNLNSPFLVRSSLFHRPSSPNSVSDSQTRSSRDCASDHDVLVRIVSLPRARYQLRNLDTGSRAGQDSVAGYVRPEQVREHLGCEGAFEAVCVRGDHLHCGKSG